jgi:hypothetical protein
MGDYDRAKTVPTVSAIENKRISTIRKLTHTTTLKSRKLGAIREGTTNSNPHNHNQVVEHKLGANPQGITRIRVSRSFQSPDNLMSFF